MSSVTGKRIFDIFWTVIGFVFLLVPMIVIAIAVRLRMGAPVLFTQKRAGKDGKPFLLYKFRSMTNERDDSGELLPDDERITPLGEFLRQTTLDELPELINVLKGDMSLVGPRPLYIEYIDLYNDFQSQRLDVKPGLTSWAVVNGRNALSWEEKFKQDVWYVQNRSLVLDFKIILLTIITILKREGVSHEDHATMPRFTRSENEDQ